MVHAFANEAGHPGPACAPCQAAQVPQDESVEIYRTEGRGENETSAMRGPTRAHSLKRLISALDSLCGADSPQSAPHSFYPRPAAPIRH